VLKDYLVWHTNGSSWRKDRISDIYRSFSQPWHLLARCSISAPAWRYSISTDMCARLLKSSRGGASMIIAGNDFLELLGHG